MGDIVPAGFFGELLAPWLQCCDKLTSWYDAADSSIVAGPTPSQLQLKMLEVCAYHYLSSSHL